MEEIWKPIPGYEGLYEVSNMGRINGLIRNRIKNALWSFNYRYRSVTLSKDGKAKRHMLHRLVMTTFVGESEMVIDHIDGDTSNNKLTNLRYCTQRENMGSYQKKKREFTGAYKMKTASVNCWRSGIHIRRKAIHLGCFPTPELAHQAYMEALSFYKDGDIERTKVFRTLKIPK